MHIGRPKSLYNKKNNKIIHNVKFIHVHLKEEEEEEEKEKEKEKEKKSEK